MPQLSVQPIAGMPLVSPGDDLASLIRDCLDRAEIALVAGDVLVVAQKIVSKAEDRTRRLVDVVPGDQARDLAARTGKDPRYVQLVLDEAAQVVAIGEQLLIVEHRLGHVMANAGIDQSNVDQSQGETVLLLPDDPDASAERLADAMSQIAGGPIGIIISDSFGRPWRTGTTGVAIGVAGVEPLVDLRGRPDLFGRSLRSSEIAAADSLAAAAVLAMGESDEASPVALVRGWAGTTTRCDSRPLIRSRETDLFR